MRKRKADHDASDFAHHNNTNNNATAPTAVAVSPTAMKSIPPSSTIEKLGREDTGMVLVIPPKNPEPEAVTLVRKLNKLLDRLNVQDQFCEWVHRIDNAPPEDNVDPDDSVRWIQGSRMEIFLEAQGKKSTAFDQICGRKLPAGAKKKILKFCRQQARQDTRVGNKYTFQNFSLIVSWGICPAQIPHIDLVAPNFQFGLFLSDKCAGTFFVKDHDELGHIKTPEQLAIFFRKTFENSEDPEFPKGMPEKVLHSLQNDPECEGAKQLLDYFGDALHMESTIKEHFISEKRLPAGTVATLPGSVVHAGPASRNGRAVLFFSASPKGKADVIPYMPDTQYNGTTLMANLVSILWRRKGIGFIERRFLLQRLVFYVEQTAARELSAMCGEGELNNFITAIHKRKYQGVAKDKFIEEKARCTNLYYLKDPFSKPENMACVNEKDMEEISVPNLYTMDDENGVERQVRVYQCISDERIILRYPTEGNAHENEDEYEGLAAGERLVLKWDSEVEVVDNSEIGIKEEKTKFNGSNGKVHNTDGDYIEMYVGKRN